MDKFYSEILRRSVHQALKSAGFEKCSKLGGEVFADVLKDYLMCLGKTAHEGAINSGRTKTTSTDVLTAFEDFGIKIEDLKEWSQTDGKILGKYTGPLPQPKIMEGLLRSEFPVEKLQIEPTNEQSINSNVVLQSDLRPLRPSYVPEWLPPFPEVKPHKEELPEDKIVVTQNDFTEINSNEVLDKDIILEVNKKDENQPKLDLIPSKDKIPKTTRRKRLPDQRPPTYDIVNVFNSIAPPKLQIQESPIESPSESPKKKRKLRITPTSLIPSYDTSDIKYGGTVTQDVTNLAKMSSGVGSLKLLKESQTKKPFVATRIRNDNAVPVTNVSSLSEVKQSQIKPPVSRKGKEKMVESSDFQETTLLNSSKPKPPTAIRRGSKVKLGKSIAKPTTIPTDKPASMTTGSTKLRIRLGKVSPIDVVTSAASPVASTSSVQSQLVVNNPSNVGVADPPEVINCICPYPFSEIDDGNFMLSCDGCQVWFHGICTGFGPSYVEVDTWYCERCRARGIGI